MTMLHDAFFWHSGSNVLRFAKRVLRQSGSLDGLWWVTTSGSMAVNGSNLCLCYSQLAFVTPYSAQKLLPKVEQNLPT